MTPSFLEPKSANRIFLVGMRSPLAPIAAGGLLRNLSYVEEVWFATHQHGMALQSGPAEGPLMARGGRSLNVSSRGEPRTFRKVGELRCLTQPVPKREQFRSRRTIWATSTQYAVKSLFQPASQDIELHRRATRQRFYTAKTQCRPSGGLGGGSATSLA
jgi:hypothetical protein